MLGFERLLDLIIEFLEFFRFCVTIDDYQQAVVLRLGKYHKILEPGFHILIPCYIDRALEATVVTNTTRLSSQSLTTKDGKSIVVAAVVTWEVRDIKKYLLGVEGHIEAMEDTAYGSIASYVLTHTWDELISATAMEEITAAVRKKAFKYGIEIQLVQFSDLVLTESYKVWNHHSGFTPPILT